MNPENKAFTLVELAIVIVIIGLLVGGVLAGQELIKQAEIRKNIKKLEETTTAITTFYAKYNYLPGDFNKPSFLGLTVGGDGNKVLEWHVDSQYFWLHLSAAKILKVSRADNTVWQNNNIYEQNYARFLDGKGGNTRFLTGVMYAAPDDLFRSLYASSYGIVIGHNITIASHSDTTAAIVAFSGPDAYAMDSKIDDGNALTGKLRGTGGRLADNSNAISCTVGGIYSNDENTLRCRVLYEFPGL